MVVGEHKSGLWLALASSPGCHSALLVVGLHHRICACPCVPMECWVRASVFPLQAQQLQYGERGWVATGPAAVSVDIHWQKKPNCCNQALCSQVMTKTRPPFPSSSSFNSKDPLILLQIITGSYQLLLKKSNKKQHVHCDASRAVCDRGSRGLGFGFVETFSCNSESIHFSLYIQ